MNQDVKKEEIVPHFMSIPEAARTGILPETLIRELVRKGKVPGFYSGRKFMINFDLLCELLNRASEARGFDEA